MNDYERIARIIRHLDAAHAEQPDLAALAELADLSPFHFHRLFSTWAAVTPKDFLQCLTVEHAKERLREGDSVLDAALETGLSGPGRLHDLCVQLEAASPGELKTGGAGWSITHGFADSPFGRMFVAESPRGICHLSFIDASDEKTAVAALRRDWPEAELKQSDAMAARLAESIFAQPSESRSQPALRAFVRGTVFQLKVWRALLKIQPGLLVSYGRLAEIVNQPTAARAVGTAVGQNPLAYLIPCHRVIRETGVLGNYRWGPIRKRAIVAWEGVRHASALVA